MEPLPSKGCPIVMRVGLRRNVFTDSLPSNGCTRRNIKLDGQWLSLCLVLLYAHGILTRNNFHVLTQKAVLYCKLRHLKHKDVTKFTV
jgi:hypothetical protein